MNSKEEFLKAKLVTSGIWGDQFDNAIDAIFYLAIQLSEQTSVLIGFFAGEIKCRFDNSQV